MHEMEEQLEKHGIAGKIKRGYERPIMIHRAIFGSVERFTGILCEHYAGKWPFFISPRQLLVVPSHNGINKYAKYVKEQFEGFGIFADCDLGTKTMNKKIREVSLSELIIMV